MIDTNVSQWRLDGSAAWRDWHLELYSQWSTLPVDIRDIYHPIPFLRNDFKHLFNCLLN